MELLLAVDLGVRTGLAQYGRDGRLQWYGSKNFGSRRALRQAIPGILAQRGSRLGHLVLEGGGPIAELWQKAALTRDVALWQIDAAEWRELFLSPREHRSGSEAKARAVSLAHRVIAWSRIRRAPSLRHDTAEAILIGLWGVRRVGWLDENPLMGRRHGPRP